MFRTADFGEENPCRPLIEDPLTLCIVQSSVSTEEKLYVYARNWKKTTTIDHCIFQSIQAFDEVS